MADQIKYVLKSYKLKETIVREACCRRRFVSIILTPLAPKATPGPSGSIPHGPGPIRQRFWWVVDGILFQTCHNMKNVNFTNVLEMLKDNFPLLVENTIYK